MGKKDEEMSVSSETKGPLKSFQALMGEGEKFSRDKLYSKAIQCYTEALDLLPQDDDKSSQKDINDRLNGLVARSACYLKIGKNDLALQDAEQSLKSNKEFTKGLYQKAEALYAMGEFELALMFYHRGKKLRSDLREFQLGINKAQEAIDNSVGDPNRVKLEASGDLSIFYKNDEDESKKKKKQPMGYVRASQKKEMAVQRKHHATIANPKTTKQLLGDLYEDRIFLDKIINNSTVTKANTKSGDAIYQLASDGIDYLDSRTDFWRQQEPLYARSKASKKPEEEDEIFKHIHRELEAIDNLQNNDHFVDARRRAQHLVDFCERLDERKFHDKQSALADAYSRLGNAYLELGDYNKALENHSRDLRIAETKQINDRRSRALDNLGRVYARSGQFPQAIQVWERKIPLATSPLEKAWLFHEIGQCQFGLGDYEKSRRYGERSYAEAVSANDPVWQLNAKVLIAHSQSKLRQYREAEQTFNEALTLAKDQTVKTLPNDVGAEKAIERAIKDARDQIDKGAADSPPDRPENTYEVKLKSSDQITYADDNNKNSIQLTVFGDNGSSGPIDLRPAEGDTKKFDVRSATLKKKAFDAGKLTKVALTYDNVDSWPLDSIEVTDTKRKNKVKFLLPQPLESMADTVDLYPEGCIVPPSLGATPKDDRRSKTPSKPIKKTAEGDAPKTPKSTDTAAEKAPYDPNKKIDYIVTVQTGSVASSGTDAHVFISLNGDHYKINHYPLQKSESGKNPFEKDSRDVFKFNDTDLGRLQTITLEHDDAGMASAWYVEFVEVKCNNETFMFPVGRWLDKKEGDKRISLDLEPNKKPPAKYTADSIVAAADPNKSTPYTITVQTGDVSSAGTDAKVFITLNGEKNKIARHRLETPDNGKDPFERNKKDVFRFNDTDVGRLKTITIEQDDSGLASAWNVEFVEVKVNNDTYMFPVSRWLDKGEGDKRSSLELEPNKKPPANYNAEAAQPAGDPNKSTPYVVSVQTGNVSSAGTDAKVFITLNGEKTKIAKYPLQKPEGGKNPFEKGNKDVFKFNDTDVGKLKTINIEHDNGGFASGWYLDAVEVKINNDTYLFPVGRWLDKDEDDGRINLELEPNKKPTSKATAEPAKPAVDPNKSTPFIVTVQTGSVTGAGTDAKVYLTMNGDKNKVVKYQLQKPEGGKNPFEKGNKDVFKFNEADVGKLQTINIEHDGTAFGAGWFLDFIEVKINSDTYMFPVGRWLDKKEDDGRISLDLEPNKKPASKATPEPVKPTTDPNKSTPYIVTVQTGSVTGAGTDAKVYLTMNGDKSKVAKHQLEKPDGGKNPFEKGNKDAFKFNEADVGKLQTINIEHDGTAFGAGWFLEYIEVKVNNETYMFPVGRWLDKKEDDGRISLDLEPNKKPASKVTAEPPKPTVDPNKSTAYIVTVQTGSVTGAGTDAKVYLTMNGDKSKVAKHQLEKPDGGKNPFEKSNKDVFKFNEADVGKLQTINIEHDGTAFGAGWFLDFIEVKINTDTYMFPVGRWLDKKEDDGRISLDLEPNKKPSSKATEEPPKPAVDPNKSTPFVVTVQTGSVNGAGTDAKVYLTMNGDKSKVTKYQLQKPEGGKNPFEKSNKDVFKFNEADVGKLQTINIEHDGSAFGAGWFLDFIEIKINNDTYMFPVDRWLDKKEDDGRISLDLEPNKKPASKATAEPAKPAVDPNKSTPFVVTVQTGSVNGAGTDAKVYLTMNGDKSKVTKYQLQKPEGGKNPFEKSSKDVFKFNEADVGKVQTVNIEHDGTSFGAGWFLDFIEIKVNNETYMFPVDRWLDKKEDDGRISLDLEPNKKPASKAATDAAKPAVDPSKSTPYIVTVQTGNATAAGTDAKVFITLNGEKSKIAKHPLQKSESGKDPFEKGNKDVFKFDDTDVGKLKTITIEHDNGGLASGWNLDFIEVKINNDTYMFPVSRWLDKGEDDGRISLELEPNKKPASKATAEPAKPAVDPNKSTPFIVTVQTGSVNGAGTDAKVYLTMNGDKSKVAKHQLEKPDGGKNPFEKGNKDVFKFNEADVGKLQTINIEHDGTSLGAGWFLDFIEIKINNDTYMFPVGRWLDKKEDDGRISLDLEPNKKPASKATEEPAKPAVDPNKSTPFIVTVQTGSVNSAGTDAKVYLTMNGDKSKVTKHQLQKPEGGKNPFEKGGKDVFKFNEADVGKLQTINIEHDGTSLGAGWFLDFIEIKINNDTYMFPVGRWLDKKEDDGRISLDLEPNKKPASKATEEPVKPPGDPNKKTPFTITTQTGSVSGAGTDANVSITLNGDKNKITKYLLKKPEGGKNPFEKGQKDVFKFDEIDIGRLQTITVEHDGKGIGSGWYLDIVEVKVNNDTTMFPVDRWIDSGEGDKRLSLDLEPNKKPGQKVAAAPAAAPNDDDEDDNNAPAAAVRPDLSDDEEDGPPKGSVEYEVTVRTANKQGAGTDASVFLSVFGDKGQIEKKQLKEALDKKKDIFEKGVNSRFKIFAPDVGKIKTIRIAHDGKGLGAGWYLDSIDVRNVTRNETTNFPVDRWLDSGEGDKRISLDLEPNKKPGQLVAAAPAAPAAPAAKAPVAAPNDDDDDDDNNAPAAAVRPDLSDDEDDGPPKGSAEYEVTVRTANKQGAGTDASVFLSVFGDKGQIEKKQLKEALDKKKDIFEKGVNSRFKIVAPDVGKIKTIRIAHDGKGLGAGWYLDSIEVRNVTRKETTNFPVDRWLDSGEGDKRISLDLEPDKKPGQLKA